MKQKKIAEHFGIDPYKLISSGVMLFITKNDKELINSLKKENIPFFVMGHKKNEQALTNLSPLCKKSLKAFLLNCIIVT